MTATMHNTSTRSTAGQPAFHRYTCPTCPAHVDVACGTAEVGHRCPGKLRKWTKWGREESHG